MDRSQQDRRRWVTSVLEECEGPLTRFALRILGDESTARDAVQHAMLRLCDQTPESLLGRERPWLFAVCRSKAIDLLRLRRRDYPLDQAEVSEIAMETVTPDAALQQKEIYDRLNALIDRLPDSQREVLGLWCEGFAYRQIAEITDHSVGNVRVLVHRALDRLRRHPVVRRLLDLPAEAAS